MKEFLTRLRRLWSRGASPEPTSCNNAVASEPADRPIRPENVECDDPFMAEVVARCMNEGGIISASVVDGKLVYHDEGPDGGPISP